jgi:enoyl-CoA hydratase/carnithine racemase
MIKQLLTPHTDEGDLAAVQRAEHRYLVECWASPEHAEAVKAFTEKRPPIFTR